MASTNQCIERANQLAGTVPKVGWHGKWLICIDFCPSTEIRSKECSKIVKLADSDFLHSFWKDLVVEPIGCSGSGHSRPEFHRVQDATGERCRSVVEPVPTARWHFAG